MCRSVCMHVGGGNVRVAWSLGFRGDTVCLGHVCGANSASSRLRGELVPLAVINCWECFHLSTEAECVWVCPCSMCCSVQRRPFAGHHALPTAPGQFGELEKVDPGAVEKVDSVYLQSEFKETKAFWTTSKYFLKCQNNYELFCFVGSSVKEKCRQAHFQPNQWQQHSKLSLDSKL